ncbi:MAG: hypothetical protein GVX96_05705 [Bacteroidetes bacterium]|jgi:hypothetical protein|nr:hypothetical protein [Bacteroidota bacterium]
MKRNKIKAKSTIPLKSAGLPSTQIHLEEEYAVVVIASNKKKARETNPGHFGID